MNAYKAVALFGVFSAGYIGLTRLIPCSHDDHHPPFHGKILPIMDSRGITNLHDFERCVKVGHDFICDGDVYTFSRTHTLPVGRLEK